MNLLNTPKMSIDRYNQDTLAITVYYHRIANKINKEFDYYPDYRIKKDEEPVFLISDQDLDKFLKCLPKAMDGATIKKIIKNGAKSG